MKDEKYGIEVHTFNDWQSRKEDPTINIDCFINSDKKNNDTKKIEKKSSSQKPTTPIILKDKSSGTYHISNLKKYYKRGKWIGYLPFTPFYTLELSKPDHIESSSKNNSNKRYTVEELINEIEIDLPSEQDVYALKEALDIAHHREGEDYNHESCTDIAFLTGYKYDIVSFILQDLDSESNIKYESFGNIRSGKPSDKYSRYTFLIRPVLKFDKIPGLFDCLDYYTIDKKGNPIKYSTTEFGWYPTDSIDVDSQNALENMFKTKSLTKTPDSYTFDRKNLHRSSKKKFKPIAYPIYDPSTGKKYIRYDTSRSIKFPQYGRISRMTGGVRLNDGSIYYNGNCVWVEITPIPWIVDIERKRLIAKEGLVCGIQFANYKTSAEYENSNVKMFLNTFMKPELLKNEEMLHIYSNITMKYANIENEIESDNDDKANEISKLLTEIEEYSKYYPGTDNIKNKISKLLNDYDKELDELSKNVDNKSNELLSVESKNPKLLYQKLKLNLEDILTELKGYCDKIKDYREMIDILYECTKNKVNPDKDLICQDINTIKTICLPFIIDNEIRNKLDTELNSIINNNIKRNVNYIMEVRNNSTLESKTLEELKEEFRNDFIPFLENLNEIVKRQDLVNDILSSVESTIQNIKWETKNQTIKRYLNALYLIQTEINNTGSEKDIDKAISVIEQATGTTIDDVMETNDLVLGFDIKKDDETIIIEKIKTAIAGVSKILFDIRQRNTKLKEINDLRIEDNISFVFKKS